MTTEGASMDKSSVQSKSKTAETIKPITEQQIQELRRKNKEVMAELNKSISLFLKAN